MLEKAIELNDTVYSRHHLALTLKRIIEVATLRPSVGTKFSILWMRVINQTMTHVFVINLESQSQRY